MRNWLIIFLIFFISCSPEIAPSNQFAMQNVSQADQVVLEIDRDKIEEKFQDVIQHLKNNGFRLHFVDHSAYRVKTAYQPFEIIGEEDRNYIRIHASVKDGRVQFSGQLSGEDFKYVQIRKSKDSVLLQQAWQKLVEIAEGYSQHNTYVSESDSVQLSGG